MEEKLALIRVKVSPGVGVGGTHQEGVVKDIGDGCYAVTYVVPKLGNYTVLSLSKTAVAATTNQLPSAAPMAVAQPIVAKTLQAPASQMQAQAPSNKGSLVVICTTTDSKDLAYIEYGKIEEPTAASNVEIARSLPRKPSSNNSSPFALPMMMQQAAKRSATELAAARAAEISRKLNPDQKPRRRRRSPSYSPPPFRRSHRSRSPYRFHREKAII
ncbi:unnamed protein product [Brassica oleracea]